MIATTVGGPIAPRRCSLGTSHDAVMAAANVQKILQILLE